MTNAVDNMIQLGGLYHIPNCISLRSGGPGPLGPPTGPRRGLGDERSADKIDVSVAGLAWISRLLD